MRVGAPSCCVMLLVAAASAAHAQTINIAADLAAKMVAAQRFETSLAYLPSVLSLTPGAFTSRVSSVTPSSYVGAHYPLINCGSTPVVYPPQSLSTSVTTSVSTSYSNTVSRGSSGSLGLSIGPLTTGASISTSMSESRGGSDQQSTTMVIQINTASVTVPPMTQVMVQTEISMSNEVREWSLPVVADAPAFPIFGGLTIPAASAVLSQGQRTYTLTGTMTSSSYGSASAWVFGDTPVTKQQCDAAQAPAQPGLLAAPPSGVYRLRQGSGRIIGSSRP